MSQATSVEGSAYEILFTSVTKSDHFLLRRLPGLVSSAKEAGRRHRFV